MSTEELAPDVSQVNDFHFHTCRKFRLFAAEPESSSGGVIIQNRLATSSQLGVTFALVSTNLLKCFPTKSLLSFKMTRENMNLEVKDLSVKSIQLFGIESINDMGVNSDGTLLAILHTRNNDVSVDVYDIITLCSSPGSDPFKPLCTTRVGTEQINQGSCLEWNPAFPDTFAAASTDRSIMVAKVNVQNPSSQKLVGIGKLGAITTAISWSPKGKQLTIGDSLGKIVQLKPELDIVRSQFGPEHNPTYGKVTGLSWLATTEWLVSFERGSDHDTYLMRCKKDKPTEWIQFHELSYASSKWPLPPQLFPATQLLVDWNVVIVGNSKTSEITTVGKRDDWQTWVPIEGESIYLPTTSNGKDTVPIGIAVDRSMTEEVSLKPDGSEKHRPSPLILCLTNDGVLTAHHVISTYPVHNSCQMASQNIPITGLCKLQVETQEAPSASSDSVAQQFPVAKPSTIFEQKPKFESLPTTPKTNLVDASATSSKPASSLFGPTPISVGASGLSSSFGTNKPLISAPTIMSAAPTSNLGNTAVATTPAVSTSTTETVSTPEDKKAEQDATRKKALIERVAKINDSMSSTKDLIMKMSFAVGKVKSSVFECAEVVKASLGDSKEVMDELKNLISSIERMSDRTQHTVKEMDFEIDEKMELVAGVEDGERILEKLRNMSETEKLMRFNKLETAADILNGKFEQCNEKIKRLRITLTEKESLRKQAVLSPLRHNSNLNQLRSGAETEVALKVMRNVSKIIIDTRERIQRTELDFVRLQREVKGRANSNASRNISVSQPLEMSILEGDAPKRGNLSDAEILRSRQALVSRIQKRGPVKTRNVTIESYKKPSEPRMKKDVPIDTSNLSNAILKLSMTPRRVMPTSSLFSAPSTTPGTKSDATTQADEPPVVKTVVVTVESPAKPVTTAPVISNPLLKPTVTTSTTTTATPKVTIVKEESKDQIEQKIQKEQEKKPSVPAPAPTSSSIFSGSLFGAKTPQVPSSNSEASSLVAGKSSLFESSLAISSTELTKTETKSDVNKETLETPLIEEVKDESEETANVKPQRKETTTSEPHVPRTEATQIKEEQPVATSTVVQTPVQNEKQEEIPSSTPSFSFNTTTTPKSTTSNSSIFGGGLKSQTPSSTNSSSIFGGAVTKTPTAPANTSSIFGGGAKTASSPFGSFGQAPSQPQNTSTAAPVTFSFNSGASTTQGKSSGFGAFGAAASTAAKPSSVFGGGVTTPTVPTVPTVDYGMEDDSMVNGGGPGGFMTGLGNSGASNPSTGSNPFAPKVSTGSAANSSWLFGGVNQQQPQQQQKASFSFNNAGSSQQPAASATGTSSVFGGAPKFGSQPAFGSKPFGGGAAAGSGLSKNASIFGGAASTPSTAPASGGFAQFATGQKTSSLFGGGSAPQSNTSIFGGGAQTAPAPSSSIFGGGASTNANKPTSFTSWR